LATSGSPAQGADVDRSRRRVRRGLYTAGATAPELSDDEATLPGETGPLTWEPGRGPVTGQEALGVLRRRRRQELARSGKGNEELPTELPEENEKKTAQLTRLPPHYLAFAHARAEIEGTNLTAVFEEFLIQYSLGKPQDPEEVAERQMKLFRRSY